VNTLGSEFVDESEDMDVKALLAGVAAVIVEGLFATRVQACGSGLPRSHFHKPLWIDLDHIPHIFLGCGDQLIVNQHVGVLVEKSRGRVDVTGRAVRKGAVALLRVFFSPRGGRSH